MGFYDFSRNIVKKMFNLQESKIDNNHRFYFGIADETSDSGGISRQTLGDTMILEPMIRKAIWKENKDIIGNGWNIKHRNIGEEIDEDDETLIDNFNHDTNLKYKLMLGGISANTYGDGFLEIIYDEPETLTISDEPIKGSIPVDLNVLQAEYIDKVERINKDDPLEYYIYKAKKSGKKIFMHPDRIIHIVKKRLPGHLFGISDIYTCHRILESKMNADKYFGEFIEWAGKGVFDLTLTGANTTDLKEAELKLQKRKQINTHDENAEWKVLNPTVMSPKEYYDYFFINIAASMDMPQHILTGVQPGQLTGSEIGLADYYNNITNLQELIFTPILERLYIQLLKAYGRSFNDYMIEWNPIYIDETSEALIFKTRAEGGKYLFDSFAIDEDEYRMIAREGIQKLSGESVLEGETPDREKPSIPIKKDEIPVQVQQFYIDLLTTEEKLALEQKKIRQYEHEKELGLQEIKEQEQRIKAAKKGRKK
jgi:hypothetical protein